VFTADSLKPYAEAVAVKDNRIMPVGSDKQIRKFTDPSATRVIEAAAALLIPGFNDAHAHFGPVDPDYIELRYVTDPAVITEKGRNRRPGRRRASLIYGGHWEHEMFTHTREWPAKELIDAVFTG